MQESKSPTFIYRIASFFSLYQLNSWWSKAKDNSLFATPLNMATGAIRRFFQSEKIKDVSTRVGSGFQGLSQITAMGLIICLGLPQFANDKIGLALISLVALSLWVAGWLTGGSQRRNPDILDFLVLIYLGINLVSACASHYLIPSLKGLSKVVVFVASYFLFTSLCAGSKKRTLLLLGSLALVGLSLSLHGLYQYKTGVAPLATWEDPTVETRGTRIYSTLGNPNLLAGFLIPIAPVLLGMASSYLVARRWILSLILYIGFAVVCLATILTGSRGGYIAVFASLAMFALPAILYVWKHKKKARPWVLASVILGLLGGAFVLTQIPAFSTRLESIFAGREHSSNSYRLNVWSSSLEMLKDNWWFGIGVGNETFRLAYGLYMISGYDALGTYCVPLEVAVECGIFGLLVFCALVIAVLSRAHIRFWEAKTGHYRWIILGIAAAIFGLMTHGFVDTVFYRPQVHFIFWLLVATLAVTWENGESSKGTT